MASGMADHGGPPTAEPLGADGDRRTVCLVGGTRPEGLKLAPVAMAMAERGRLRPVVVASGQHPTMFHQAIEAFDLRPDVALRHPHPSDSQPGLLSSLVTGLDPVLAEHQPDAVMVQGDTTTTLAAALAAFWRRLPVVHLEAGLRSWNLSAPFPEEANRKLVGQISSLHLAPTPAAVRNLDVDGIRGPGVLCIGNTVVDAALTLSGRPIEYSDRRLLELEQRSRSGNTRPVLVTVHRRESWGEPLRRVLAAVDTMVRLVPDIEVVLPAHPNPLVRGEVDRRLGSADRVMVTDPLPYRDLMRLLKVTTLVLSDSGGIQEEVASFGVPVLVLREVTERMEAIEAGFASLVGTDVDVIVGTATRVLTEPECHLSRPGTSNPFGDGLARYRAEQAVAWYLGLHGEPPAPFAPTGTTELVAAS
ncbi:MAG TPA: UDP-N-acetylglucosamine 2-epimerase (non-hydrolyzing) [Micromonosporaceae bacterium]